MPSETEIWSPGALRARWSAFEQAAQAGLGSLSSPFLELEGNSATGRWHLTVYLTRTFMEAVGQARLSDSHLLWKTFQNLRYGYDARTARSRGGRDGIFVVSPDRRPRNALVRKLFDRYADTERGRAELALYFRDIDHAVGVRVVSHSLRLLGFIEDTAAGQYSLVLLGVDRNRR